MNRIIFYIYNTWRKLAYYKRGPLRFAALILLPCSWLFGLIGLARRELYRSAFLKSKSFLVPIISVGNVTVGGVGKTPFTLFLADRLQQLGYQPAILFRGYGRKSKKTVVIQPGSLKTHLVAEYGDEPSLLAFQSSFPIAISKDRATGVNRLLSETGSDVILLDDGFQHLQLKRDIDFVLVDGKNPFGNGRCLPYGPMREPRTALRSASALIVNGTASAYHNEMFLYFCKSIFEGGLEWDGLYPLSNWMNREGGGLLLTREKYKQMPVVLVSGVGSPDRLHNQALANGLMIHKHIRYPDHYWFTLEDVRFLAILSRSHPIVITEKDAIRLFSQPKIPTEFIARTYVIKAVWHMKRPEFLDQWLQKEMSLIASPFAPVDSPIVTG